MENEPEIKNEKFRQELLAMKERDQDLRSRIEKIDPKEFDGQFLKADIEHVERLKEIIKEFGWPAISLVGEDGSNAVWLLVQHADHDLEFQKECLELIKDAESRGEAKKNHIAFLTDRVRVNSGQPQVFGTQFFKDENGKYAPRPIENESTLDERRMTYGLDPFEDYLEFYRELNQKNRES